jgi:hypothetical protein
MSASDAAALNASEKPFILVVKVLLWVFWGVALYFMFAFRDLEPAMAEDDGATVFLAMFAVIWVASTLTLAQHVVARGPAVRVGADGLWDRRVFRAPIPWSEIVSAETKGRSLTLTVKDPHRFRWLSGAVFAVLPFLKPWFRSGRFDIALVGLDCAPREVAAAVAAHVGDAGRG